MQIFYVGLLPSTETNSDYLSVEPGIMIAFEICRVEYSSFCRKAFNWYGSSSRNVVPQNI